MKADKISYSCGVLRFILLFILPASLLVLPNSGCERYEIDSVDSGIFKKGHLEYTVLMEEPNSNTRTVSVRAGSTEISGDIKIPASVTFGGINYSVTEIGQEAFSCCYSLTSIIIPDSVTEIGWGAFSCCYSLTSIIIPDSVTSIGAGAFEECNKLPPILFNKGNKILVRFSPTNEETSYTIPDTVTYIAPGAFYECSNLTEIMVGEINPNFSSLQGVLFNKDQSTLIQYPSGKSGSYTIPDSVTEIGEMAFQGCSSLESVILGKSVAAIGFGAFGECSSLTSITIPDSVTSIGEYAFKDCSKLTDVYFKGNAPKLPEENAFFDPSVIYYKPGTTGWTNPWDGRPTKEWVE